MPRNWSALRENYLSNGFVVAKGLIPARIVEQTLKDINDIFALQLSRFDKQAEAFSGPESTFQNIKAVFDIDHQVYLGTIRRAAKLLSLHKFFTHNAIIDGVQNIAGVEMVTIPTEPVMHIMSEELKLPNGYFGFGMHQDWPSIQGSLDVVITWAPLVPVTSENFPLLVVPESHKLGLLNGEMVQNGLTVNESYDTDASIKVPVEPGDVIYFTGFTLHQTALENCKGFRLGASARYENAAEPSFVARNFPCAYQRSVHRELFTPNFPSQELVLAALGCETSS